MNILLNTCQEEKFHMKRSTALICISLLFFIMVGPVSADATEAIIQADHLNVRSGPGTDYDTIGQVNTDGVRAEGRTSELESRFDLVRRPLLGSKHTAASQIPDTDRAAPDCRAS